jgi:hypothetical protein
MEGMGSVPMTGQAWRIHIDGRCLDDHRLTVGEGDEGEPVYR